MTDPLLLGFRDATEHPGHKNIQIFVGRRIGSRGNSGTLVFRDEEWPEARERLLAAGFDEMPSIAKWPGDTTDYQRTGVFGHDGIVDMPLGYS